MGVPPQDVLDATTYKNIDDFLLHYTGQGVVYFDFPKNIKGTLGTRTAQSYLVELLTDLGRTISWEIQRGIC